MFDKLREKARDRDEKHENLQQAPAPTPAPAYESSLSHQAPPPFQTHFASMSMHAADDLRFLSFPTPVIDACRATTQALWSGGIQREGMYANSYEFKLSGYPWSSMGSSAMQARRLMAGLLGTLHGLGWVLTLNTDVSKSPGDKDTLLFRHQSPSPALCDWCSISFSRADRMRLIDVSPEVCQTLCARLGQEWVNRVGEYAPGIQEIKFHGYPWSASGKETMRVRGLFLVMLATLEEEGWTVYASVDQSMAGGSDNTSETDTVSFVVSSSQDSWWLTVLQWHCCRLKGWVRGAPVYHGR
jgi:hypothetical protein